MPGLRKTVARKRVEGDRAGYSGRGSIAVPKGPESKIIRWTSSADVTSLEPLGPR